MVVRIRQPLRRAAAGAFVALSLGCPAWAQECFNATTAPVRDTVQEFREYLGGVAHAADEQRLATRKAELDRRAERLAREYAEYNAEVERYYWRNFSRQNQTGLYLPEQPVLNRQLPPAPVQTPPAVQQYGWPQAPTLFDAPTFQQPAQATTVGPRERSLIYQPASPAYGRPW